MINNVTIQVNAEDINDIKDLTEYMRNKLNCDEIIILERNTSISDNSVSSMFVRADCGKDNAVIKEILNEISVKYTSLRHMSMGIQVLH
jgi:hypothetical protein